MNARMMNYRECVELLLFFKDTFRKKLLYFPYKPDDSKSLGLTTPFRELIKYMPGINVQLWTTMHIEVLIA